MKSINTIVILFVGMLSIAAIAPKKEKKINAGTYTISLAVQDINNSFEFYQKLGFEPIEGKGSVAQKWIILSNGDTKIGLFQGMFPSNTITFNPNDGRTIFRALKAEGIKATFSNGMENESGPCTFSLTDPDGNPILFDQH